jgi:hypothetical protein
MWRNLALGVVLAGVLVVVLGAYLAPRHGLEWPYPQRLPASFVSDTWPHHPWNYDQASRCRSVAWWKQADRNFAPVRRVGTMPSAWWFEGSPLMTNGGDAGVGAAAFLPDIWVKTRAGCYVRYEPRHPVPP